MQNRRPIGEIVAGLVPVVLVLAMTLALVLPGAVLSIDYALAADFTPEVCTGGAVVSWEDGGGCSDDYLADQTRYTAAFAADSRREHDTPWSLDTVIYGCSGSDGMTGLDSGGIEDDYVCGVMEFVPSMPEPSGSYPKPEAAELSGEETYERFSWRDYQGGDWTSPAKNQRACGSCWAFAALGALETVINIEEGDPDLDLDLSEQYVLSCFPEAGDCSGGTIYMTFEYIKSEEADGNYVNGIIPESSFPYQAIDTVPCSAKSPDWESHLIPISGYGYAYTSLPADRDFLKSLLMEKGPLATYMTATGDFMSWGGTYHDPNDYYAYPGPVGGVNHAVLIVGYNDDPSIENGGYWIVKNSWGTSFGYDGFYNVEYGSLHHCDFVAYVEYEPEPGPFPPYTSGHDPAPGSTDVPVDTSIAIHVQDDIEGVDVTTITMTVEGVAVTPAVMGTPFDYTLTYDPPVDFGYSQVVNVTVDASDLEGNVMPTDSYSFTTATETLLDADFLARPLNGDEPMTVVLTDLSTSSGDIISWLWNFGDGKTSTAQNPIHTYVQDGIYTVSLSVSEANGSRDTETKVKYVRVNDTAPMADFSAIPLSEDDLLTLVFNDVSASHDGIISWLWDFGDGSSSFQQNPQHTYAEEGSYAVTLTVTEVDGSQDVVSRLVAAGDLGIEVTVELSGQPLEGCMVYACTSIGSYTGIRKVTDASGQARFVLPEGSYKFLVYYNGSAWWSAVAGVPGSVTLEITADTVVNVSAAGVPLSHYRVYCYTAKGSFVSCTLTDAAGQARFTLAGGSYKFRVDYNLVSWWSQVVDAPGTVAIDIRADDDIGPAADFSAVPLDGSEPLTVVFTDLSTSYDGIASWLWNFGDGGTSTAQNPTHIYVQDGLYTVSLAVTEADGDIHTKTRVNYVNVSDAGPAADFSAVPLGGGEPLTVVFTDLSTSYDGIASWLWNFGDGGTSTAQNPTHIYVQDGLYTVSLAVTEADGDVHTKTRVNYINVSDAGPAAGFSAVPLAGGEPLTVEFTDLSTSYDGIASWLWNFGDGGTSTAQNPTHIYVQDGLYTVSLTVTEADGDVHTKTRVNYINVSDAGPAAGFSATPAAGGEPLTVEFTDLSTSYDGIASWLWNFGDGGTSTAQNPTHIYVQDGLYTVSLAVTEADGDVHTKTRVNYINVSDAGPAAGFSATPADGGEPLTVEFTDLSTSYDGIASWLWNFGDGGTSTAQNPTHIYVQDGLYTVSLTVTEADGDVHTKTRVNYINVSDAGPAAGFSAVPLAGGEPLTVEFTDLSTSYDGIASWLWNFGDGGTSTAQNPTHIYVQDGLYTVSLTVTEADGDVHTKTRVNYINVSDAGPAAGFSATPADGGEPLTVEFTDLSTSYDGIASWLWNFGDGGTSTAQNPTHIYVQDGLYTVSLTVTEADGSIHTVARMDCIEVSDAGPTAAFSATPLGEDEPLTILFADLSASYDGIVSWLWDFGDGNSSLQKNPQHTYAEEGSYAVTLTIAEDDGSQDVVSEELEVISGTQVTVTLSGEPLQGCLVYACNTAGAYAGQTEATDLSGQARFDLPEGSYKFKVYYDGTPWWSEITLVPGAVVIDIPAPTVVEVTTGGIPLCNYRVYAYTAEGAFLGCVMTDSSGQAKFELAEGSYKFKVFYGRVYWWSEVVDTGERAILEIPY